MPDAPKPISAIGRIIGAIVNPRPTFEDIARKPSWLAPLLVVIIFALATTYVIGQRVGWGNVIQKQISQSSSAQRRMEQLPPDQRADIINRQAKVTPIFAYAANIIIFPIACLVIAGILMGAFNATGGAGVDFKTSFGIVTHAYMPSVIVFLLGILIMYLKSPDQIDVQNLVASNLGAVLSNDAPRWLVSLGGSIDLFSFWMMALMALGFSVARPRKISMSKGLTWIVMLWLIYVVIKVGLAAAFS
ncbi:MAG TPA: YIP1 family protein [Candidatus Acidoferrales bacterium]|nr:YIP1 family protein [Candidatus Acidoferrales bacterium]